MGAKVTYLQQYHRAGEAFLNQIVMTNEMLVNLYDPETKKEGSVWKRCTSPPSVKARGKKSAAKVLFILFLNRQGMLLVHPV